MRNIKHQVFFEDTLKFFLSLYGHKLPVTSIDISSDNALLVSGSADKNIKLWGLDFGDCHRSIFAHGDAVTSVALSRQSAPSPRSRLSMNWLGSIFRCLVGVLCN